MWALAPVRSHAVSYTLKSQAVGLTFLQPHDIVILGYGTQEAVDSPRRGVAP